MLYLVATPIGNLADITYRAVEVLKSVDYILCEDTRHSLPLLSHYGIRKPLISLHKFNEISKTASIIEDLKEGKQIALISDAGTPGISDPGALLVHQCTIKGIRVVSIPGPCAAIMALSCSGMKTDRFQFLGFLPKKSGELRKAIQEILIYPGTTVCYESPKRLLQCLSLIEKLAPQRMLAVARELTKKFEELRRGFAAELISHWTKTPLKGEIVLLIEGNQEPAPADFSELTPEEHVRLLQETYHLSLQESIKMAASLRRAPKREIYNLIHRNIEIE